MNKLDRHTEAAPDLGAKTAAHLDAAVSAIDAAFGEGYAREHPELVASLVQASAIDGAVAAGEKAHGEAMALAIRIAREMNETLLALKPRLF